MLGAAHRQRKRALPIVLAAGRSQRMGTQELLLPINSKPMIAVIVDAVLQSPVAEICVVVGRDAEQMRATLAGRKVQFVSNPDLQGDMLSSVRCGWRALPAECAAALIVLGDQPGLTGQIVNELLNAFAAGQGGIVLPKHGGHRAHPLLVSARFRDEVLARHDGIGLKGLLAAHPKEIHEIAVTSAGAVADVDSPEDYARLRVAPEP